MFQGLFPDTFDRAVPVINHKEVDGLLLQVPLVPHVQLAFHCICHRPLVVLTVLFPPPAQIDLIMWRYEIVSLD